MFDAISTEMEKEQVCVCQIFIASHTYENGPCRSIDMCQHVRNRNYETRNFSCSDASFCFDRSKFRGVSKETISALKRTIVGTGRTARAMLVLSHSITAARGNILCMMSFCCAVGNANPRTTRNAVKIVVNK